MKNIISYTMTKSSPLISDSEFDKLKREILDLEKNPSLKNNKSPL